MKVDFISDTNNELHIKNGDFVIGDNSLSQAKFIINANKGEIRNNPNVGIGINQYLGGNIDRNLLFQLIQRELKKEGIELKNLSIEGGKESYEINIEVY